MAGCATDDWCCANTVIDRQRPRKRFLECAVTTCISDLSRSDTTESIRLAVEEMQAGYGGLDGLIEELFVDLDQMREEVVRKARELDQQKSQLVERESEFKQQEAQISEMLEGIQHLSGEVALQQEQSAKDHTRELEEKQRRIDELDSDRQDLLERLEATQAELADQAQAAKQLTQAQEELARLQSDLASAGDGIAAEQLSEFQHERSALESELELVRGRAAELYETVETQKRELADQRSEMADELKQLRSVVENQAGLIASLSANKPAGSAPAATAAPAQAAIGEQAAAAQAADPVLGNVMAQFQKLQKDVAQRRKRK